jgi:hypothetical protein
MISLITTGMRLVCGYALMTWRARPTSARRYDRAYLAAQLRQRHT